MIPDLVLLASAAPITVALLQALKAIPWLKERTGLQPALALLIGLVVTGAWLLCQPPAVTGWMVLGYWAIHGLIAGVSAAGLYSVAGKKALEWLGIVKS